VSELSGPRTPGTRGPRAKLDNTAVFSSAARWIAEGRRLDMRALAAELGVTRMTLHRYTGGRERLIGGGLWVLAAATWRRRTDEEDARRSPGDRELRSVRVIRAYNTDLFTSPRVRQLFDAEPELSLRVLTDPQGPIQPRSVAVAVELIESDEIAGRLRPVIDREQLAHALVKLAEAFLFSDLASGRPASLDAANEVQAALLEAGRRP